jgi:hypothetical protein
VDLNFVRQLDFDIDAHSGKAIAGPKITSRDRSGLRRQARDANANVQIGR